MIKRLSHHLPHYLSLVGIFVAATLGFLVFSYDKIFQAAIITALAAAYVAWGIIHHAIHKDLYLDVVVEYIVYAILGMVIVFSVIFRS